MTPEETRRDHLAATLRIDGVGRIHQRYQRDIRWISAAVLVSLLVVVLLTGCEAPLQTSSAPPTPSASIQGKARAPVDLVAMKPPRAPLPFLPEGFDAEDALRASATSGFEARLVAILTGGDKPKAMFVDAMGFGHIFEEGDAFWGGAKIEDIREGEVEIAVGPYLPSGAMAPTPRTVIVRLHDM